MNDNMDPEGPRHAQALSLLNDLALILRNAEARGIDVVGADGERVFQFGWWAKQCDAALGLSDKIP